MKLIVGLGNPGEKYKNNRHNVGFWVVDSLKKLKLPGVVLLKPQTYMNRSGIEVKKLVKKYPLDKNELYVIHDDLDIELGKYKLSLAKGPKVHNGLQSIYQQLGTKNFWHVRVGIDNRPGMRRVNSAKGLKSKGYSPLAAMGSRGEEYVLSNFRPEEREKIKITIINVIKTIWGK